MHVSKSFCIVCHWWWNIYSFIRLFILLFIHFFSSRESFLLMVFLYHSLIFVSLQLYPITASYNRTNRTNLFGKNLNYKLHIGNQIKTYEVPNKQIGIPRSWVERGILYVTSVEELNYFSKFRYSIAWSKFLHLRISRIISCSYVGFKGIITSGLISRDAREIITFSIFQDKKSLDEKT